MPGFYETILQTLKEGAMNTARDLFGYVERDIPKKRHLTLMNTTGQKEPDVIPLSDIIAEDGEFYRVRGKMIFIPTGLDRIKNSEGIYIIRLTNAGYVKDEKLEKTTHNTWRVVDLDRNESGQGIPLDPEHEKLLIIYFKREYDLEAAKHGANSLPPFDEIIVSHFPLSPKLEKELDKGTKPTRGKRRKIDEGLRLQS